jgi:uncharacterized membrane protein
MVMMKIFKQFLVIGVFALTTTTVFAGINEENKEDSVSKQIVRPFDNLSDEIKLRIFSSLEKKDVLEASPVSSEWLTLLSDNFLWKPFASKELPVDFVNANSTQNIPFSMKCHVMTQFRELDGLNAMAPLTISGDGKIIAGTNKFHKAVRWTAKEALQLFKDEKAHALAVNEDGSIIVGYITHNSIDSPCYWTSNGDLQLIENKGMSSSAIAVSKDGNIILCKCKDEQENIVPYKQSHFASERTSGGFLRTFALPPFALGRPIDNNIKKNYVQSFLYSKGESLDHFSYDDRICPTDISVDGSTVVGHDLDKNYALFWTEETGLQKLDNLKNGCQSWATAVSRNGNVIVGKASNGEETMAVRWSKQQNNSYRIDPLDINPNQWSTPTDISDDGKVIIGYMHPNLEGIQIAFRWTEKEGMQSIAELLKQVNKLPEGWFLENATSMSGDGSIIVGTAYDFTGQFKTIVWRAVIPRVDVLMSAQERLSPE